jgi:tetratricopeptide (TPR) repeat protein
MQRNYICFLLVILTCGLRGSQVVQAQTETVVRLDGARVSGKITEMNANGVSIERNRATTKIAAQEIDHIRFSDEPLRMNQVREQISGRQFEQAAKELAAFSWEGLRPDTVLDGLYYSAKVKAELALMGVPGHSISDAVTLLRRFQETGKNHYQYHRGQLLFGQLAFSADRLPLAIETFQGLTNVADQNIALQSSVELGNALLLAERGKEAQQAFQKAVAFDLTDPLSLRWKQIARILAQVAEAESVGVEAATSAIQAIIAAESPDDAHINAVAYNALGRLQFQAQQTRDAELSYLHTELLFAANAQAHPEALYFLSKIWSDGGQTDRATEARAKLKGRYGGTYWAAKLAN